MAKREREGRKQRAGRSSKSYWSLRCLRHNDRRISDKGKKEGSLPLLREGGCVGKCCNISADG